MSIFSRTHNQELAQLRKEVDRLTRLRETTQEDWFWGRINSSGTEEDYYWRRLSDNWAHKDVLPSTYLDIHNQCFEAFNANPMASAVIEMGVNFTLGDGLQIDAQHTDVQKLLDNFWNDPDNRMALRQYDIATELSLYGEIFVRFFVNRYSGHVKIAMIDPVLVDEIECDPDNIEHELRIHRRATSVTGTTDMVPKPTDPGMRGQWFTIPDEVRHFTINKVTNAKRGKSDLATLLPWLRRYKDWLIDRVRINKYKSAFLWDVTLQGADRKTIETKMMEYARPPEPGSVLVHNEAEQWNATQPQIAADDVASDGHAIKLMVAMGAGLPEHFLGEGGDVNRATAAEMGLPVVKKYQRRQDYLKYIFTAILDRVIVEARDHGTLRPRINTDYVIVFPQLQPDDVQSLATSAHYIGGALATAMANGLCSRETASKIFFNYLREEVDANDEAARIQNEQDTGITPPGMPGPTAVPPQQNTPAKPTPIQHDRAAS